MSVVKPSKIQRLRDEPRQQATASALHAQGARCQCLLCGKSHETSECDKWQEEDVTSRKTHLKKCGLCYKCTKRGHLARQCLVRVKCHKCAGRHVTFLCDAQDETPEEQSSAPQQALADRTTTSVFLQTLRVVAFNGNKERVVRVLLDSGAQRSYICQAVAYELGYDGIGTERMMHALFGGSVTQVQAHESYKIQLKTESYSCNITVLGQMTICADIPTIPAGPWLTELYEKGIVLSDVLGAPQIDVLIGADVFGRLLTGRVTTLSSGLTAVETLLGWTLMGKVPILNKQPDAVYTAIDLLCTQSKLEKLWDLETLGIEDPVIILSKREAAIAAKEVFLESVRVDDEGRYEVPWLLDHATLPSNSDLAKGRLERTLRQLHNQGLTQKYNDVLMTWLHEGVIEKAPEEVDGKLYHYLPHRPVLKEESTTKIRPVFDASAHQNGCPSLNDCLEKGENLLRLIPEILLGFRKHEFGITADIKAAFLQISVNEADRDVLRFWWRNEANEMTTFRHRRVVFGVNCSPFLLGATISYHLERRRQEDHENDALIEQLARSFYVDNCVTSLDTYDQAMLFQNFAKNTMRTGGFDLRGWLISDINSENASDRTVPVLGLMWDHFCHTLSLSPSCVKTPRLKMTKRAILSEVQRVFDPIGFSSPVTITAKIMLQQLWRTNVGWDETITGELAEKFDEWSAGLSALTTIAIPRHLGYAEGTVATLHVFCDASQLAYAAAIFVRLDGPDGVRVRLVSAKSRVPPAKPLSIPRLELMAATIGSRLFDMMKTTLDWDKVVFWSDSSTALAWIRRKEEWAPFVGNRVKEIRQLSDVNWWRHVPGKQNPADLPSRGCTTEQLIAMKWWEGPAWLWDRDHGVSFVEDATDEVAVGKERRKRPVVCLLETNPCVDLHLHYFSKYTKIVRLVGWIRRFCQNCRRPTEKKFGEIDVHEYEEAETQLWKIIQREYFGDVHCERLKPMSPLVDEAGVIRLRSRICAREDAFGLRYPIVLPGEHDVVRRMIYFVHVRSCHVGPQGLMSELRENFWVIGGRRAIKAVINSCITCKRFSTRRVEVSNAPLPKDRVRDAAVFEVAGVDFAGPCLLKDGQKAWVCLFTCAVYRAVHLELTTSLSTVAFIQGFRRFVARRGRPRKIFSDNGRNFVGAQKLFAGLDWGKIGQFGAEERIEWVFNPPSAPWWGGFWERLVGLMKRILRKVLGRASLTYEELVTVLCDCENVMNSRPLTMVSCGPDEFRALTPNSFLKDLPVSGVPDCDNVDKTKLCSRATYQQTVRDCLRRRFRAEYMGQLQMWEKGRTPCEVEVGHLMLLEDDNKKRLDWPMVRVEEVVRSRDGQIRVAKVRTPRGVLLRPTRRLFPMECDAVAEQRRDGAVTRSGRISRKPDRLLSTA